MFDLPIAPRDAGAGPKIGIAPRTVLKQFGPVRAVGEALRWTWDMTRQTFDVVVRLVTAQLSPKTMMGPLGIDGIGGLTLGADPISISTAIAAQRRRRCL